MVDREHGEVEKTYLVVRKYRSSKRVLLMTSDPAEARQRLQKEQDSMRDGSLCLFVGELNLIWSISGGYNRTRW